ncbi:MAG TPA: SCP2 sterol-binding domain-containing protein [Bacteroidales bacterium]|nr:SCP2 sterol-binding domain-containing protein [Bacteroidales bacterium]HPS73822.1 SCP2 sterol-binding domain-containing protein [Bacteroidales bacterium]
MTTIEDIKKGLEFLKSKAQGERFREATEDFDRVVQYHFTDPEYIGHFAIRNGAIEGPFEGEKQGAEIHVEMTGDTFTGLLNKEINPLTALIKGQIKIKASFMDLMKLKNIGG